MKKIKEKKDVQKSTYQKIFIIALIVICIVVLTARLFLANTFVDQSKEVAKINTEIDQLNEENAKTSQYIRENSSLSEILIKAKSLGMSKVDTFTYLSTEQKFALNDLTFGDH